MPMIKQIPPDDFLIAANVIRRSFATVASEFGITKENCPTHTSFITAGQLNAQHAKGYAMFGLFNGEKMIGFVSVSKEAAGVYVLHNLAVLPEHRRNGYGKELLNFVKKYACDNGGGIIKIDIIEENNALKQWYTKNGFRHTGTKRFEHLPFTVGFMECAIEV